MAIYPFLYSTLILVYLDLKLFYINIKDKRPQYELFEFESVTIK